MPGARSVATNSTSTECPSNMGTTPSALEGVFFLDTNIFVYAWLQSEPLKKQRAIELLEQALASRQGCISYQVIQEFANVATRKFAKRLSPDECLQFIDAAMQPINRAQPPALT